MVSLKHVHQSTTASTVNVLTKGMSPEEPSGVVGAKVSFVSWLSDESSSDYPEAVQQYLDQAQNSPALSEKEKNALFFNLVLRPKSEARSGSSFAQDVISKQDSSSWKNYLLSLQYLSTANEKQDKVHTELHQNLTKHYQILSSRL